MSAQFINRQIPVNAWRPQAWGRTMAVGQWDHRDRGRRWINHTARSTSSAFRETTNDKILFLNYYNYIKAYMYVCVCFQYKYDMEIH